MNAGWKIGVLGIALGLTACSSSRTVQVPPRVDLAEFGAVGLIEFSSSRVADDLRQEANREFLAAIQAAQPGTPVLELGEERRLLDEVQGSSLNPEALRAIGQKNGVDVILYGVLDAKEVRPKLSVGTGLESLSARAEIEGSLIAKMIDTRTGATLWSCSASDRRTLAALSVSGGGVTGAGANHPDEARSELFRSLVVRATSDFRPTWRKVKD